MREGGGFARSSRVCGVCTCVVKLSSHARNTNNATKDGEMKKKSTRSSHEINGVLRKNDEPRSSARKEEITRTMWLECPSQSTSPERRKQRKKKEKEK